MTQKALTLTVAEAAQALGISRNNAYTLANSGVIPTIRLGKRLLVSRVQLDRLLAGDEQANGRKVAADR